MDLAESPPSEGMRRVEVVPLASCRYACPGCPVGGGASPISSTSRSPEIRLAGSLDLAAAASREQPRGAWVEWWGPAPEEAAGERFEELARAGLRGVGLVALGIDPSGAAARGWRGGDRPPGPEEILARLEEARGAGLKIRLGMPQVGKSRYDPGMRIGWEEASRLQRAAWNAAAGVSLAAGPVCFTAAS